jgi:hypothetical protein
MDGASGASGLSLRIGANAHIDIRTATEVM